MCTAQGGEGKGFIGRESGVGQARDSSSGAKAREDGEVATSPSFCYGPQVAPGIVVLCFCKPQLRPWLLCCGSTVQSQEGGGGGIRRCTDDGVTCAAVLMLFYTRIE